MALDVLVVAIIIELALAILVAPTVRRLRRTVPLATLVATAQASVAIPAPAAPAPLAATAPAAVSVEAVVVAPLVVAHVLVAVVAALDDKICKPLPQPIIKIISYEKVICNSCYCRGHYARSSTGNL